MFLRNHLMVTRRMIERFSFYRLMMVVTVTNIELIIKFEQKQK